MYMFIYKIPKKCTHVGALQLENRKSLDISERMAMNATSVGKSLIWRQSQCTKTKIFGMV
jgi:hypothetical protein